VVNLQAQLACLREQAAQSFVNVSTTENPSDKYFGKTGIAFPHDLQGWLQMENSNMGQQFLPNLCNNSSTTQHYVSSSNTATFTNPNPIGNYENNSGTLEESMSFSSFDETSTSNAMSYDMQAYTKQRWGFNEVDDLQSVAFGFTRSAS